MTLTGHVESYWQKRAAEKSASRVKGVKAIAQEIEVRLPLHITRSDEDIAAAAVNRMSWDAAIPPDAIMVSVTDGVVTLTGNVDHAYQRIAALWAVQSLWGVRDVDNQVAVLGPMKKQLLHGDTVGQRGNPARSHPRRLDSLGRPRHHHGRKPHPHRLRSPA